MLSRGIYLPPSPYEAWFLSAQHGMREIENTLLAHAQTIDVITRSEATKQSLRRSK